MPQTTTPVRVKRKLIVTDPPIEGPDVKALQLAGQLGVARDVAARRRRPHLRSGRHALRDLRRRGDRRARQRLVGKSPSGDVSRGDGIIQLRCLVDEGPFKIANGPR